ncbi:hypothetical protein D3C75_1122880 [compost metagenome]
MARRALVGQQGADVPALQAIGVESVEEELPLAPGLGVAVLIPGDPAVGRILVGDGHHLVVQLGNGALGIEEVRQHQRRLALEDVVLPQRALMLGQRLLLRLA